MKKLVFLKLVSVTTIAVVISVFFGCVADPAAENNGGGGGGGDNSSSSGGGGGGGGAGNTREKAVSVAVGNSSSHTISSSGEHWFKFVGTGDPVIFETTSNVVSTRICVYTGDNTGGKCGGNEYSINTNFGTIYFIKIELRSSGVTSGTYTFVVKEE